MEKADRNQEQTMQAFTANMTALTNVLDTGFQMMQGLMQQSQQYPFGPVYQQQQFQPHGIANADRSRQRSYQEFLDEDKF